ncbi:MAG: hypothetical protein JW801_18515 [Bacteroidales bacterium]|nr:hypothetical protein [Bacteroidales bacterium]
MIASDVKFIRYGASHLSNTLTAYLFAIFKNGWEKAMRGKEYPNKGDITIKKLLQLRRWDLDIEKITKNIETLTGNSIEKIMA